MTWHDARLRRVASHRRNSQCVEAISATEEPVRDQPANAELYHQLGMCYSGTCSSHALLSIGVAVCYFERAVSFIGSAGPPLIGAQYLDSLGNARLQDRPPETAILYLSAAAEAYATRGLTDDWAREQFNPGNAFCDVPDSRSPRKWQFAVGHAATAQNPGSAHRERADGDRTSNVRTAITCYSRVSALRHFARAPEIRPRDSQT